MGGVVSGAEAALLRGRLGGGVVDLAPWHSLWYADESPLDGSGNALADGTVVTLADLSGNGRDMTSATAGVRPDIDSDGGPGATPALAFIAESMRTAAFDLLSDFTMVLLTRQRSTGFGAGERIVEGDGTPTFVWQRNALSGGVGTNRINATTPSSSGNFSIAADEWVLIIAQCVTGSGRLQINDNPFVAFSNATAAFEIDRFSLGKVDGGIASADQDFVMAGIIPGAITDAAASKIRTFAAARLGHAASWSDERQLLDTFSRADGTTLGVGESRHRWVVTGDGAAHACILDGKLTIQSGWGTIYCVPQINFQPQVIEIPYSYRPGPGSGSRSTSAVGIGKFSTGFTRMMHFVFNEVGYVWELYDATSGLVKVTVLERVEAYNIPAGTYRLTRNLITGEVSVTDPSGTTLTANWNATSGAGTVAEFNGLPFFEIIASADTSSVISYDSVMARP